MERMEHFRGKLLDGDQVLLDPVEGQIASHALPSGQKSWFGHFALPAASRPRVGPGVRYRLALDDGRSGDIYIDIHEGNPPGSYTAEFQVTGGFKEKKSLRPFG